MISKFEIQNGQRTIENMKSGKSSFSKKPCLYIICLKPELKNRIISSQTVDGQNRSWGNHELLWWF